MDVGSEEREQLHREGQVQPGGGFPAPVCSQARGVATPPPPRLRLPVWEQQDKAF